MLEPTRLQPSTPTHASDFEEFFRLEHVRLFRSLLLLTGDAHEAEDVAQEALLRAYERWDRVRSMESPIGYVYRTSLNLYRSRLRKIAVRARRTFGAVATEDIGWSVAAGEDVRRALASIPSGQREALVLVDWLGLASEEAGRILGIDASSVRSRIRRARVTLRELLGETDE